MLLTLQRRISRVEQICKWVSGVSGGVPVFAKLTPNVTDIVTIATAAQRGGAANLLRDLWISRRR